MASQLQTVLDLLEHNKLSEALKLCQNLVAGNPTDAQALHLLGIIQAKLGKLTPAIECFTAAIKFDPQQATYHNSISNAYKILGNLELAIRHLHHALKLDPNNAQSYNNLGSLYYTQGSFTDAMPQFEKAIRLNPNIWEAHYNLANCYIKEDMVTQAISHYQTVLRLNPAHENAKLNLAMSLVSLNDYAAALPYLEDVAAKYPQHPELQAHLATAYLELGKANQAIAQFNKALNLTPNRAEWQHNLAVLYLREQKPELAKTHFTMALQLQPDNQIAKHMLDSLSSSTAATNTSAAPAEYVSTLFNQYADYYNEHMTKDLHYTAPALLRQTMSQFLTGFSKQQHVLDLGCGTGLCGVYFRDVARLLIGVDISPAMLEQARALGAYDGLVCCNILESLPGQNKNYFDLIIAADVLVYIGNLAPLFAMLATTLKQNGLILFTIEEQTENNSFLLQNTGRYAHSQQYIAALCIRYNFTIEVNEAITPRMQHEKTIPGRLYAISLA